MANRTHPVLPKFTDVNANGSLSIYYVVSTWNPYQTMIMHTNLRGWTFTHP
jgi:hypothetical protein